MDEQLACRGAGTKEVTSGMCVPDWRSHVHRRYPTPARLGIAVYCVLVCCLEHGYGERLKGSSKLWTPQDPACGPSGTCSSFERDRDRERAGEEGGGKGQREGSAFHYERGRLSDCQCLAAAALLGERGSLGPELHHTRSTFAFFAPVPATSDARPLVIETASPSIWTGRE